MESSSSISRDMARRMSNAKKCAETSEEGTVSFLELSMYPLVSLFITTGAKKSESSPDRHIHFRYVMEPTTFSKFELADLSVQRIGYEKYLTQLSSSDDDRLCFDEYKTKFNSTSDELNSFIYKYHGWKCFEDGDVTNSTSTNIIILHLCDVMNIIQCKEGNVVPDVYLKTNLLSSLDSRLCNLLDIALVGEGNMKFFLFNIDYFYICYGYFGNTSFVPIRTTVDSASTVFQEGSFFTNNEHFRNHQEGKLMELNQNEENMITKMVYRSI